jgi:hypothetical protein
VKKASLYCRHLDTLVYSWKAKNTPEELDYSVGDYNTIYRVAEATLKDDSKFAQCIEE